jgi:FixJ family two-component response regulator
MYEVTRWNRQANVRRLLSGVSKRNACYQADHCNCRRRRALQSCLATTAAGVRFETNAFGSAEEFLASYAPESHACLILDIHLPGISGFELFDRLSASDPQLPVIFVTAEDRESIRYRAHRISNTTCLQKPFIGAVLLEAVRVQLGRGGSTDE